MNAIPVIRSVNRNPPFPSKWPEVRVGGVPVCVQVAIQVNDLNLFDVLDLEVYDWEVYLQKELLKSCSGLHPALQPGAGSLSSSSRSAAAVSWQCP